MFKVLLNNIRSRGAKFEIFRKHDAYLLFVYCCKYTDIMLHTFGGVKRKPEVCQCSQAMSDALALQESYVS